MKYVHSFQAIDSYLTKKHIVHPCYSCCVGNVVTGM